MPRRSREVKRDIPADAKYQNVTLARLINKVMIGGQKKTAARIVYDALEIIEQQEQKSPMTVFE